MSHPTNVARFVEDLDGGVLAERLGVIALEHEQQDIAQEFAGQLNVELAGCECLLGTFSP